jgi:predicted DNA binding CopG/RHH family protein
MPTTKASQRAVNKYMKENYDRINLTMPRGKKEEIQAHASRHGLSVNAYINQAIDEKMAKDTANSMTSRT